MGVLMHECRKVNVHQIASQQLMPSCYEHDVNRRMFTFPNRECLTDIISLWQKLVDQSDRKGKEFGMILLLKLPRALYGWLNQVQS